MNVRINKKTETATNQQKGGYKANTQFNDNRVEAITEMKLQHMTEGLMVRPFQ